MLSRPTARRNPPGSRYELPLRGASRLDTLEAYFECSVSHSTRGSIEIPNNAEQDHAEPGNRAVGESGDRGTRCCRTGGFEPERNRTKPDRSQRKPESHAPRRRARSRKGRGRK